MSAPSCDRTDRPSFSSRCYRSRQRCSASTNDDQDKGKPRPMWEIRLGYSIYQNSKRSQKQMSRDSLRHKVKLIQIYDPKTTSDPDQSKLGKLDTYPLPNQTEYQMCPRANSDSELRIDVVYRNSLFNSLGGDKEPSNESVGYFLFTSGSVASKVDFLTSSPVSAVTEFQYSISGRLG